MTEVLQAIAYAREELSPEFAAEVMPLLKLHYLELAKYQDIPLEPDFERYYRVQLAGDLYLYTVRDGAKLIGYAVFFRQSHMHYSTSMQATQDIVWLMPEYRGQGIGGKFLEWCHNRLAGAGVQVLAHHVKAGHPALGHVIEAQGFELQDLVYTKRLDMPVLKFPIPTGEVP